MYYRPHHRNHHGRYPSSSSSSSSSAYSQSSAAGVDVESLPIFLSTSSMDPTTPTTSPTSPTPRVRLPFRASAAPAQSPAWPAHVPQGESKGVRSPSQPRTRSRPGTTTSAYSRPSSSRGDPQRPSSSRGADTSTSPLISHLPRIFAPAMDREEGSGSSTDDSMDPAEPHTPVEASEPALWPSDPIQLPAHNDVSVDEAAKRESCFTLSAYLTNSPSATWSSSAENTPVIDNVTRFSGQTFGVGTDENEALSDRRRAAVVAAAGGRRDSSSGSSTEVPSAGQNTRRPSLTVMTNDPDDPFAASFRGSTSGASLTSFLSLDSSATSTFDPARAGGSTSTPPSAYRRGVPASSSSADFGDSAGELLTHVSPEAPSSSSPRTASVSPVGKRAPGVINTAIGGHGVSPATTPTRMRAGTFSPAENGGAARATSTTPTRNARPGTRDGGMPQLASPSAAGHAVPTASSCAAQPAGGSTASPRDAHARYAAQEVQDASGDPSLFLTSASAHSLDAADMRTPIASPSPSKMQALADAAGAAKVPCDMTFGDPNATMAPSPTKSMRGMSFLPLEIMPDRRHGHTRDDSDSFSSSGPHTPVAARIGLQPEVRTRSGSSVHTPSPSRSALLGDALPRNKTRTPSSSRTPSPARSVDTTGTLDDGGFIVAPPLGPEPGFVPLRPWAAEMHKDFGAVRPSSRRPSTANPTGAPSTPPLGGPTGSSRSRPSTAREPASPPMFRTTTQTVPTSVSMDSPPLSDAGSPLMSGQVSFGSSILIQGADDGQRMQPLSEAARRQVDDGEVAGLGIEAGPGPEDEWSSRYAHALRDSLTARRELSRQDRPGTAGGDPGWHASSSRSATHQPHSKPATPDGRPALSRPDPAPVAVALASASARRPSDADMLSAAARSFHSIPTRRSRRPGTSAGAASPSPPAWKTPRPTTADNAHQHQHAHPQRPATASPVAVLRRDSAASSTATATSETALDIKLPKELGFLTTAYLELWIDQEGFRAVRPTFWLVASRDSNDLAEFKMRPVQQSFVFHHAALDSAPVLRRLTLNGDESRDYMSRQASLSVKKNGVYTVSGNEDRGKLFWRFEYSVTDRMDVIGRPMSGEKSFTPLLFCCTPELLMPAHGKKVHLLHVMRKSVTPKLSAAKITHSASNSVSSPASSNATPPPEIATVPLLSDTASLGRRRAASHSFGRSTASQTQRPWTANTPTVTRPSTAGVQ